MNLGAKTPVSGWQLFMFALIFGLIGGIVGWAAFAAPHNGGGGGGGGKGGKGTSYTGTFSDPVMVTDNNGNGLPNWGDVITFTVNTNAPYNDITVKCSQNGTVVYGSTIGFGMGWPWPRNFTLQSAAWTGGAASCTADFWASTSSGTFVQDLQTKTFDVGA